LADVRYCYRVVPRLCPYSLPEAWLGWILGRGSCCALETIERWAPLCRCSVPSASPGNPYRGTPTAFLIPSCRTCETPWAPLRGGKTGQPLPRPDPPGSPAHAVADVQPKTPRQRFQQHD